MTSASVEFRADYLLSSISESAAAAGLYFFQWRTTCLVSNRFTQWSFLAAEEPKNTKCCWCVSVFKRLSASFHKGCIIHWNYLVLVHLVFSIVQPTKLHQKHATFVITEDNFSSKAMRKSVFVLLIDKGKTRLNKKDRTFFCASFTTSYLKMSAVYYPAQRHQCFVSLIQ